MWVPVLVYARLCPWLRWLGFEGLVDGIGHETGTFLSHLWSWQLGNPKKSFNDFPSSKFWNLHWNRGFPIDMIDYRRVTTLGWVQVLNLWFIPSINGWTNHAYQLLTIGSMILHFTILTQFIWNSDLMRIHGDLMRTVLLDLFGSIGPGSVWWIYDPPIDLLVVKLTELSIIYWLTNQ